LGKYILRLRVVIFWGIGYWTLPNHILHDRASICFNRYSLSFVLLIMELKRIDSQTFFDFIEENKEDVAQYFGADYPGNGAFETVAIFGVYDKERLCSVCSIIVYLNPDDYEHYGVHISDCYTCPSMRKKGCLTMMVEHAKSIAKQMQCPVTCTAILETSYPIFKKLGFTEIEKPVVKMILKQ
jgi:GNAT superfamily N-acetyltransferase